MKTLMMTAAASALMLGAVACSQASDDIEMGDATYGDEIETAETDTMDADTDMMAGTDTDADRYGTATANTDTVFLASSELSADELIGAEVIGADGEQIATVDDLLINASGDVQSVIFKSGDFLDIVGDKGALAYDQLDLAIDAENEPRFSVAMTEDAIQQVAEFEQQGMNDYRLASEIIGTSADLLNSDESTRIEDLVIDRSGNVQYAVIGDPISMNDKRQLSFDRITVEQGDGGSIVIDATAEDISAMPLFAYQAEVETDYDSDMSYGAGDSEWENGTDTELPTDTETELSEPQ